MYLSLIFLTAALSVSDKTAAESSAPRVNDDPFLCGAVFAVVSQAYKENGQEKEGGRYYKRFQTLFDVGKSNFEETYIVRNRNKSGADQYMQEYVDRFSKMTDKQLDALPGLIRFCEKKFP